jgi:hypothetical protein
MSDSTSLSRDTRGTEAAADFNCGWSVTSLLGTLSLQRPAVPARKPASLGKIAAKANAKQANVRPARTAHRHHEYL